MFDSIATDFSQNKNNLSYVGDYKYINEIEDYIVLEINKLKEKEFSFPLEKNERYQIIKLNSIKEEQKPDLINSWSLLKNMAYQEKIIKELEKLINVYKKNIYIKYYN